jgi:mono/diheme cytochrome c family protein
MAGTVVLFLINIFARKDEGLRNFALKKISKVLLFVLPVLLIAAWWYYSRIPSLMIGNLQVAVATQDFQQWYGLLMKFVWIGIVITAVISIIPFIKSNLLPRWSYIVPVIMVFAFAGLFERLREFIRKPYIIGDYLYTNGIRKQDYALLQKDGILKHAVYVKYKEVNNDNKVEAGRDIFMLTCSRCHTTNGINNVTEKFELMYGAKGTALSTKTDAMTTYITNMHNARYFMPPFPGNEQEAKALVAYIQHLQTQPGDVKPAQSNGITIANNIK